MLSAVSHGNRKHPINVTVDLLLLAADLTQLDSDWRDAEAHSLPLSVPLTPGSSDYETQGQEPLIVCTV